MGYLAGMYRAAKIAAVDERITNKNLCIIGSFSTEDVDGDV